MQSSEVNLINLGDELLNGKRLNTHLQQIALKLAPLGLELKNNFVTRDNKKAIKQVVSTSWNECSITITTGGLGPTNDDNTKEGIAEALDLELIFSEKIQKKLESFFAQRGKAMSQNNLKQCYYFKGSLILENPNGTAPGLYLKKNNKILIALPGPPEELMPMLENQVIPRLKEDLHLPPPKPQLHVRSVGLGECFVEESMEDLKRMHPSLEIAYCAHPFIVDIYFTWAHEAPQGFENHLKEAVSKKLQKHLLCFGNQSLELILTQSLRAKKMTLALAESCTGGLISHLITSIPGVSDIYLGGATTYSNTSKNSLLGVPLQLLQDYGAVSPQVAESMAKNASQKYGSDYALSTTGIAGPTGESPGKPIGLVYIGLHTPTKTHSFKYHFSGSRHTIQQRVAYAALDLLRCVIHNLPHE